MARRLNKQFVIPGIIVAVVLIVGLGLAAKWKLDWSKNPLPSIQEGDQAMKDGRYQDAIDAYAKAIRLKDTDPMVWVKLGDAHNMLSADDINNLYKARGVWENAIQQDPRLMDAHQRLLKFWMDWGSAAAGASRTTYLDRAADAARGILRVAPDDKLARRVIQEAVVESWLSGAAVDQQKIEDAITELRKLQTEDPTDPEIPFAIARAQAQQGFDAMRRNDRQQATILLDEAVKTMDDAIAANPQSGAMLIRKAQLLSGIGPRVEQDKDESALKQKIGKLNEDIAALAEKARELIQPTDTEFVQTWVFSALMQQRIGKLDRAEEILSELVKNRPEEIVPRIQLADLLRTDNARWQDALNLVTSLPPSATQAKGGVQGQVARGAETRALLMAADIRLDLFIQARGQNDSKTADALFKQIEEDLTKIAAKDPDNPNLLRVRGKKELFNNELVACVQTLRRALTIATDPNDKTKYEIMYLLARAFQVTQQTGEAEKLYREMIDRVDYVPARIELARLLLFKRSLDEAAGHIATLKQQQPKNPEVLRLELALAEMQNKSDNVAASKRLADLPEGTDREKTDKARIALAVNQPDEALRLMQPVYDANRDKPEYAIAVAAALNQKKEIDKAIDVLSEFSKRHPDNLQVRGMLNNIAPESPEERQKRTAELALEGIRRIEDPVRRTTLLFEFHRRRGEIVEAEKVLNDADASIKSDPKVLDCMYQLAFAKGEFDKAESYIEALAKADQDNAGGLIYRTRILMARAETDPNPEKRAEYWNQATATAVKLTQERGDFSAAWQMLAQVYQAQRRHDEAINAFNQSKDRQAQNMDAYEGLVRSYLALGRSTDAKRVIDQAKSLFPNAPQFVEYGINWEQQYGDPSKIISIREEMLKNDPENPLNWGNLGAAYAASAQSKTGDEQRKLLEKARQTFADGIAKFPAEISLISTHADLCLVLGRYEDGLKPWMAAFAMEQYKDSPAVLIRVGDYMRRGGKYDAGVKFLTDYLARKDEPMARLQLAEFYNMQGKLDLALEELNKLGNMPRAIKRRTELLINNSRLAEAEAAINAALQQQPDNADYLNRLAFVYLMSQRNDAANEALKKVLAKNPRDPEALFYSSLYEINAKGDLDRAITNLQMVRDMVPDNIDARKLLVDAYLRRNRLESGIEEMENILRIEPEDKFTRIKLIETYLASTPPRTVDAERLCREAAGISSLAADADMKHAYARTLLIKGDIQGSVGMITEARKIDPDNLPLMDTYFRIMMGSKQYQTVVTEATKLIEKYPDRPWLYGTRAAGLAKLKQTDKALADFEKGYNIATEKDDDYGANNIITGMMLEISPEQALSFLKPRVQGNPSRMFLLAQVNIRAGKLDDAIKAAEDALAGRDKLRPNQVPQVMDFLGTAYLQQSPPNVTRAAATYDELLKIQPGNFRALNNMAYLKMMPQSGAAPVDALAYSQRAFDEMMKANLYEAEIADTHGWVLIEAGRVDQGIVVLREAVGRRPTLVEGWYHLALGHYKKGELRDADDALRRAEELMDSNRRKGLTLDPVIESKIKEMRVQMPPSTSALPPPDAPVSDPTGPGGR